MGPFLTRVHRQNLGHSRQTSGGGEWFLSFFFFFPFSFKVTNKFLSLQGRASTLVETFNVYISSNSSE